MEELRRYRIPIIIGVLAILVFFSWSFITITIPAGHRGVLFRQFGGGIVQDKTYGEGLHFIAPWNSMYVYEVRQKESFETMEVLSSNGLEIKLEVSIWFKPMVDKIGYLHATVGEEFEKRVVTPSLRSSARAVLGRYTPEEIYSTKRESIQVGIYKEIKKLLDKKYIDVDQVLIRSILLPNTIKTAIESKLRQEQEDLAYEFKLKKEKKEAERRKIEALGKAEANRIISESLTDNILREKGIQATTELANSKNSKVVVVGSGKDGLPLILGK